MDATLGRIAKYLLICLLVGVQPVNAVDNKVLKIAGWNVYADPENANKTIGYAEFEAKNAVTISFTPLNTLDEIIAAAESGEEYDIFIISNEGIKILREMGVTDPLEIEKIPQYQNLHHGLKYSEWTQFDGQIFGIPWAWGPTGLMYNKDIVTKPESWEILWSPAYKGRVAMWDDVSIIWTAALALGYENVYNLRKNQLEAVKKKLIDFNDQKPVYYSDSEELELAKEGKIVAFNSWYDPSDRLRAAGQNFAMILPKEGAVGMFDSYLLSKDCEQDDLVHRYINYQISPEVQNEMVKITGLAPANMETLALLSPEKIKALHLDEPDYFNRMLLWDNMPRKNLYEQVMEAVKQDWKNRQQQP